MKKFMTKINNIGIQNVFNSEHKKNYLFFNLKDRVKSFVENVSAQDKKISFEFFHEYTIDDEILNYHVFENFLLLIGRSNKKLVLFNHNGEKLKEYQHYKKITNSLLFLNEAFNYVLISDKFGEIYYKNISQEKFDEPPKILYGHSDPIHFMRVSPSGNSVATADTLGKIKLVEFPNIYNMITVFLYNDQDIKFCDFLNSQNFIVITSKYEVHIWSLLDFKLKSKYDLKEILDIKIDNSVTEIFEKKEKVEKGIKDWDNSQDHQNFLRDDENIINIFYLKGKQILLQINPNVKLLNEKGKNINFIILNVSEDDKLSLQICDIFNSVPMNQKSIIYLSDEYNQVLFLDIQKTKEQNSLYLIESINYSDIK